MNTNNQKTRGFSLVEVMIAMAIGLTILAAISLVLVNSKKNYTTQDSMARLQESARFAVQFLTRDLRMTGYYGCSDDVGAVTNTLNGAAGSGNPFDTTVPIQGSESKSDWQPVPAAAVLAPGAMKSGTDAIALRYLDGSTAVQVDEPYMNTSAAALHTSGGGLQVGEIVMVTDCSSASVFQITGPGSTGDAITGTVVHNDGAGTPGNSTKNLGKIYEGDAKIAKFYYAIYYIADNANGQPALFRESTAGTQELVEGIENLQVLYGVDVDGNGVPDTYKKATAMTAADWTKVYSVRFGVLVRSLANVESKNEEGKEFGTDRDTKSYDIDGDGTNDAGPFNDRYQRRVFRTTVVLRNLQ